MFEIKNTNCAVGGLNQNSLKFIAKKRCDNNTIFSVVNILYTIYFLVVCGAQRHSSVLRNWRFKKCTVWLHKLGSTPMRPLKSGRWATPSLRPKKVSVEKEYPC